MQLITPTDSMPDIPDMDYLRRSIFLAGPINRDRSLSATHWQREAIDILTQMNFSGTVFCPKRFVVEPQFDYDNQVDWEHAAIRASKVVLFWVPRDEKQLKGFTTNIEFGLCCGGWKPINRIIYGRPVGAPKTRYMDKLYLSLAIPRTVIYDTLQDTIARAALLADHCQVIDSLKDILVPLERLGDYFPIVFNEELHDLCEAYLRREDLINMVTNRWRMIGYHPDKAVVVELYDSGRPYYWTIPVHTLSKIRDARAHA